MTLSKTSYWLKIEKGQFLVSSKKIVISTPKKWKEHQGHFIEKDKTMLKCISIQCGTTN